MYSDNILLTELSCVCVNNGIDAYNNQSYVDDTQFYIDAGSMVAPPYLFPAFTGINTIIELSQVSEDD